MNVITKFRDGSTRPENCEAVDKSSIAGLSASLIDTMTSKELLRVILATELPSLGQSNLRGRLAFYDRDTLIRLAHVARQSCANHRS